jgi:hypothetical protein
MINHAADLRPPTTTQAGYIRQNSLTFFERASVDRSAGFQKRNAVNFLLYQKIIASQNNLGKKMVE